MGTFVYGATAVQIDDRTLAHLRIVVMNKLRRSEPFMFEVAMTDGSGRRSYWIHPGVPLQLLQFGTHQHHINRTWIDLLMRAASGSTGLAILPEPAELRA